MTTFYTEIGLVGWLQVAACLLGLLWTLVCAVLLGLRWKVSAVLSTAPLALHAVLVILGATMGGMAAQSVAELPADMRAMSYAMGLTQVMGAGMVGIVAVPSGMLLALGGAAGGVRAPRAFGAPVLAFLACGLAALLPLGGLFNGATMPWVVFKVLVYGAGAVPVALSLLGNGQNTNARESSVAAAIAYFTVVASVELADSSSTWLKVFSALANADAESKSTLLAAGSSEVAAIARFGWFSLALAAAPLLAAVLRPAAALTEEEVMNGQVNPSGIRIIGTGLALVVPLLWFAATLSADPSGLLAKLMSSAP